MFYKKGVLENYAKLAGKHLRRSFFFFFNKVADPQHKTFLKKRDPDMAFSREFYAKILLTAFL